MTIVALTAIAAPAPQPLAYQHRARLLCATCFDGADMRPRPYGGAVIPIPSPALGRPAVARRMCAGCGVALTIPGLFGLGVLSATRGALDACRGFLHIPPKRCSRLLPSSGRADSRAIPGFCRPRWGLTRYTL